MKLLCEILNGDIMAILAKKSGLMIGVLVLRETEKAIIVRTWDKKRERRVPKADKNQKLFECTSEAEKWINTQS